MKKTLILSLLCPIFLMTTALAGSAATVYSGGFIYVKAGASPVEAVVVQNGKFSYAGGLEGALQAAGQDCLRVDLHGRTIWRTIWTR